jgi:two-component system invasion response regulator UvrY
MNKKNKRLIIFSLLLLFSVVVLALGLKYFPFTKVIKMPSGSEKEFASPGKSPHENLSDREFQILCLIASGKSLKEIGEALCISGKTVSSYRARILEKMNMSTNADLTRYALEHDLI